MSYASVWANKWVIKKDTCYTLIKLEFFINVIFMNDFLFDYFL